MRLLRAYTVVFLAGAVLGTALDHLHVAGGATSYRAPFLFGQAIWVPALFGGAALGFADLHRRLRLLFGAEVAAGAGAAAALLRDLALFTAAYAVSAFVRLPTAALLSLFAAAWALRILLLREPAFVVAHGLACAGLGVLAEWTLTSAGVFTHHFADVLGVPFWLPGLYLLASPLLAGIDDAAARAALAD